MQINVNQTIVGERIRLPQSVMSAIRSQMPYVLFLLCAVIWSASFMFMKLAVVAFTPLTVGAWRVALGAMVLGVLCRRRGLPLWPRAAWLPLAILVVLGCVWPYVVQPLVVERQGSAFMGLCVTFLPLLTILVSWPLLGFRPSRRQWIGAIGALACLVLLFYDGISRQIPWTDLALASSVPLGYAFTNVAIRGWLRDVPAMSLTFVALAISSVVLLPLTLREPIHAVSSAEWWKAIAALATLGMLGTGLATYWFNHLVQDQGPLFAGMVTNLAPVGAVLLGWLDGETVTSRQATALVGILLMVAVVQYRTARRS